MNSILAWSYNNCNTLHAMLTLFLYCLLLFAFWILLVRKVPKKIDSILNYLYFGSVTKGDLMLVAISFSYCQHLFKHITYGTLPASQNILAAAKKKFLGLFQNCIKINDFLVRKRRVLLHLTPINSSYSCFFSSPHPIPCPYHHTAAWNPCISGSLRSVANHSRDRVA